MIKKLCSYILFILTFTILQTSTASAFAILTHEAMIDGAWKPALLPLLKQRFPDASTKELEESRAYVYGGSVIPDIGYHPFGSGFFSDLFHYVRTGDFVSALIEEAKSPDEYAFALGVLCHYVADIHGHSSGTNHVVPMVSPRLKKKYGNEVNYEQAPLKHMQVEFGFDVLQVAKGNYNTDSYNGFVNFKISEELLDKAFYKTYGLHLKDVFPSFKTSVETFRFSVKSVIPELTKDAWKARKSAISKLNPLATEENFYYRNNRREYKKLHKSKFSIKSTFISVLIGVLPKFGPLAVFRFKEPTPEGEKIFDESFKEVKTSYAAALNRLRDGKTVFSNMNLDTGEKTGEHEYELTVETYDKLVKKHKRKNFEDMDAALRNNIISFFNKTKSEKESSVVLSKLK